MKKEKEGAKRIKGVEEVTLGSASQRRDISETQEVRFRCQDHIRPALVMKKLRPAMAITAILYF